MIRCRFLVFILTALTILAGCAGQTKLTRHRSAHFELVNQHLDLGGTVYLYLDIDGDVEMLAAEIQTWLAAMPELKVDLPKIIQTLGLDQLTAIGLSSVKDGPIFRNKAFLYHRGQARGLLRLGGDKPHPFELPRFAPADADLAFEGEFMGKSLFAELEPLITELAGAEALAGLNQNIPGLQLNWRGLIEMLDTRMLGVVRMLPEQSTSMGDTGIAIPRIDAVLAIDSLGGLFDALKNTLGQMPLVKPAEDDRLAILEFVLPIPPGLEWFSPVLAKHKATGRVFLATHMDYLRGCLDAKNPLAAHPDFKKAIAGLPLQGNSMGYSSSGLTHKIKRITDNLPGVGQTEKQIITTIMDFVLPTPGLPTATVTTHLADGVHTASNTTSSHKESLLLVQYLNPMVLGILSAVAIPAFTRYEERSLEVPRAVPVQPQAPVKQN